MLGPDGFPWPAGLLAYVGLGPGQEFLPQFVAMLSLAATALLAVLQWPITALLSRISRAAAARKKKEQSAVSEPRPLGSGGKTERGV